MNLHIINGPNLNLLGTRETDIYGTESFETYFQMLVEKYNFVKLHYYQSNVEGELINQLQSIGFSSDGIILNAGGYTHTSVALTDTVKAISTGVVEVHISNIYAREEYRKNSLLSSNCIGIISGLGLQAYDFAIQFFIGRNRMKDRA
ncbi:MAG TPA: type II 3-dehydroquinate dehydratase [Bacteroidia bacterium]|nr:type II 3-dehydroquinate dehydratase [Bacteroidia bacterium]HNT80759.1 type II 3-dehydroquinate dehydratase [Bacteroidia bacterium]